MAKKRGEKRGKKGGKNNPMSNCVAPEMEKLDLLDVAVIAVAEFVPQDVFRCARVSTAWRARLLGTKQKGRGTYVKIKSLYPF